MPDIPTRATFELVELLPKTTPTSCQFLIGWLKQELVFDQQIGKIVWQNNRAGFFLDFISEMVKNLMLFQNISLYSF